MKEYQVSLRFIDYFRFLTSSLKKLTSYLDQNEYIRKVIGSQYTEQQIQLLLRKGVYPYEYTSSLEKLEEKELPSKKDFHSTLTDSHISDAY